MQGCASLAVVLTGAEVRSPLITGSRTHELLPHHTAARHRDIADDWHEGIKMVKGADKSQR